MLNSCSGEMFPTGFDLLTTMAIPSLQITFDFFKDRREVKYKLLKCDISNEENDNVFFVTGKANKDNELMDIGKKCKDMFKLFSNNKLKQCERCGCLIEIANNKVKYCNECGKIIKNEQNKSYFLGK